MGVQPSILKYAIFVLNCFDRLNMMELCLSPSHAYTRCATPQGLGFSGGSFRAEIVVQLLAVPVTRDRSYFSDCWLFYALAFLKSQISKVHQAPTLSPSMAAAKTILEVWISQKGKQDAPLKKTLHHVLSNAASSLGQKMLQVGSAGTKHMDSQFRDGP